MLIISYDISDDKLRAHFSKFLEKDGRRLQYSVFELKNSDRILRLVLNTLEKKFAKRFAMTDSVIIFRICEGCKQKVVRYGYAVSEEQELVIT